MYDIAKLAILIETGDIKKAQAELNRLTGAGRNAERGMTGAMGKITASARQASLGLSGLSTAFAGLVGALSAREFIQAADTFTNITSKLKLVTGSMEGAKQASEALFEVSQRTRQSFDETVTVYQRFANGTKELGISQSRLLAVVETVNKAVTLSGASAQSAQAALVQLGQGLAAGTLRGEELNSVLEQTPALAQALADGLGVGIGELRAMGAAGEITAEKVITALEKVSDSVDAQFSQVAVTVGQAGTAMGNAFVKAAGSINETLGVTDSLIVAMNGITDSLEGMGDFVSENGDGIISLMTGLSAAGVAGGIYAASGAVATLNSSLRMFALTAMFAAANPVVLALLGIGAAVGGASYLVLKSKEMQDAKTDAEKYTDAVEKLASAQARLARMSNEDGTKAANVLANAWSEAKRKVKEASDVLEEIDKKLTKKTNANNDAKEQNFYLELLAVARATDVKQAEEWIKKKEEERKAAQELAKEIASYTNGLKEQIQIREKELSLGRKLTDAEIESIRVTNQYGSAVAKSIEPLLKKLDALDSEKKAIQDQEDALDDLLKELGDYTKAKDKAIKASTKQSEELEKGNAEIREEIRRTKGLIDPLQNLEASYYDVAAAKLEEKAATMLPGEERDAILREAQANKERARLLREQTLVEYEKGIEEANQEFLEGFLGAFKRGTDDGIDYLRDQLKRQAFQILINATIGNTGALGGALSTVFGSGDAGALGTIGQVKSLSDGIGLLSSGFSALTEGAFSAAFDLAKFAGATTQSAASFAGAAGQIASVAGPLLAGAGAIYAISQATKGEKRQGQKIITGMEGTESFNFQKGRSFLETESEALSTQYFSAINQALADLGSDARLSRIASAVLSSGKGRGGVFASGQLSTGQFFGDERGGSFADAFETALERYPFEQNRNTSIKDAETGLRLYIEQLDQAFLQALQAASGDFQGNIREYLNSLGDVELLSPEQLQSAKQMVAVLNQINNSTNLFGIEIQALDNISADALTSLSDMVGGIDNLISAASFFSQEFLSAEKQFENLQLSLLQTVRGLFDTEQAFNSFIQSVKGSRDAFVDFYQNQANPEQFAGLTNILEGIDRYYDVIEQRQDDLSRQAIEDAREQQRLQDDLARAQQQAIERLLNLGKSISEYLRSLEVNDPTLSPQARLQNASSQFNELLARAQGGDEDALRQITGSSSTLLSAAQSFYGSGEGYQSILQTVKQQLSGLPAVQSYEQMNLEVLGTIVTELEDQTELLDDIKFSLVNDLVTKFDDLDTTLDGLIDYNEFRNAFGGLGLGDKLQDIFNAIDENGDGTISKLEAANAKLGKGNLSVEQILKRLNEDSILSYPRTAVESAYVSGGRTLSQWLENISSQINGNGQVVQQPTQAAQPAPTTQPTQTSGGGGSFDYSPVYSAPSFSGVTATSSNADKAAAASALAAQGYSAAQIANIANQSGGFGGATAAQVQALLSGNYALGGAFMNGIEMFANGGTFTNSMVNRPTMFNMGLMGEAGPEAIMPLTRGAGGRLGVTAQGLNFSEVVNELRQANQLAQAQIKLAQATAKQAMQDNAEMKAELQMLRKKAQLQASRR